MAVLLLTAMFGIIQYGSFFWSLQTASATAREAARALAVGTDWTCVQARTVDAAKSPTTGAAPPVVTRVYKTDGGLLQGGPVRGSLVTVTVSFHTLDMGLPFLPLPDGGVVEQSSTARVENVPPSPLACS